MFNISSVYPVKEGSKFDYEYYLNIHMPMSIEKLSNAKGYKGVSVERGISLETPCIKSSFYVMCHYYFETLEDFMKAFEPHASELQNDIKNYTNIEPIIQINEVKIQT